MQWKRVRAGSRCIDVRTVLHQKLDHFEIVGGCSDMQWRIVHPTLELHFLGVAAQMVDGGGIVTGFDPAEELRCLIEVFLVDVHGARRCFADGPRSMGAQV